MLHFLSTPPVVYYSTLHVSCTCVPPGGAIHQCATPHGIHDLTTRHECFGTDMDGDGRERDCRAYTLACPFVLSHQTPLLVHCITPAVLQLPYLPAWETHSQQCYIFLRSLLEALYTGESSPQDTPQDTVHWRVVSSRHWTPCVVRDFHFCTTLRKRSREEPPISKGSISFMNLW